MKKIAGIVLLIIFVFLTFAAQNVYGYNEYCCVQQINFSNENLVISSEYEASYKSKNLLTGDIQFHNFANPNRGLRDFAQSNPWFPETLEHNFDPFAIIGSDDRVRITNTNVVPYSAIAFIQMTFPTGYVGDATGFLVYRNVLVTAAHNLYHREHGMANRVMVAPGANGAINPNFGDAMGVEFHMNNRWITTFNRQYDYAVVILDRNIGNLTGWLGMRTQTGSFNNQYATVTGFPGEYPKWGQMWSMRGRIQSSGNPILRYSMDTTPGQSGSPVYLDGGISIAIHVGSHTNILGVTRNEGVRFTRDIFDFIVSFRVYSELHLSPERTSIRVGETTRIRITVTPTDSLVGIVLMTALPVNRVDASLSGRYITVTGRTVGTATISVAHAGMNASVQITVSDQPTLQRITVSASNNRISVGGTSTLIVNSVPSGLITGNVTWINGNPSIASLSPLSNSSALVFGEREGTVEFIASYRGLIARVTIIVHNIIIVNCPCGGSPGPITLCMCTDGCFCSGFFINIFGQKQRTMFPTINTGLGCCSQ